MPGVHVGFWQRTRPNRRSTHDVEEYDVHGVRRFATTIGLVLAVALLGGCADDAATPSQPAPIDPTQPIEITVDGDTVEPNGARVQIERDQEVQLVVTSDRAGELHLHSTPEQSFPFPAGTTEFDVLIDRPGVADMELHDPDRVVLQFEVR